MLAIDLDSGKAEQKVKDLRTNILSLADSVQSVAKAFKDFKFESKALKEVRELKAEFNQFANAVGRFNKEASEAKKSIKDLDLAAGRLANKTRDTSNGFKSGSSSLRSFVQGLNQANSTFGKTNLQIVEAHKQFKKLNQGEQEAARGAAKLADAIKLAGKYFHDITTPAEQYQRSLVALYRVYRETGKSMAEFLAAKAKLKLAFDQNAQAAIKETEALRKQIATTQAANAAFGKTGIELLKLNPEFAKLSATEQTAAIGAEKLRAAIANVGSSLSSGLSPLSVYAQKLKDLQLLAANGANAESVKRAIAALSREYGIGAGAVEQNKRALMAHAIELRNESSAVGKTELDLLRLRKNYNDLSPAQKKVAEDALKFAQSMRLVSSAIKEPETAMSRYRALLDALKQAKEAHINTNGRLGISEKQYQQGLRHAEEELKKATLAQLQAGRAALKMSTDFHIATQAAAALRGALMGAGLGFGFFSAQTAIAVAGSYAVAKGLAAALKVGAEFEKTFERAALIMGDFGSSAKGNLGVLGDQALLVKDKVLDLARNTQFGTVEVAEAAEVLAQAGFTAIETYNALEGTLNIAAIGSLKMADAANVVVGVLSGFQKEAKDLDGVVDVLAKTVIMSNLNMAQLSKSMTYAAPVANQLGLSLKETAVAFALLGNYNIKDSRAGTSFRRILTQSNSTNNALQEILKRNGKSVESYMQGSRLNLRAMMADLEKFGTSVVDMKNIFGQWAITSAIAIRNSTDPEALKTWELYEKQLEKVDGVAKELAAGMRMNLTGALENLNSALETVGTTAFDVFGQGIENEIRGLTDYINTNADSIAKSLASVMKAFTQLTAFAIRHGEVIKNMFLAYASYTVARIALTSLAGGIGLLTAASTAAAVAAGTSLTGWAALGAMLTGPVGAGLALAAAAATGLYFVLGQGEEKAYNFSNAMNAFKVAIKPEDADGLNAIADQMDRISGKADKLKTIDLSNLFEPVLGNYDAVNITGDKSSLSEQYKNLFKDFNPNELAAKFDTLRQQMSNALKKPVEGELVTEVLKEVNAELVALGTGVQLDPMQASLEEFDRRVKSLEGFSLESLQEWVKQLTSDLKSAELQSKDLNEELSKLDDLEEGITGETLNEFKEAAGGALKVLKELYELLTGFSWTGWGDAVLAAASNITVMGFNFGEVGTVLKEVGLAVLRIPALVKYAMKKASSEIQYYKDLYNPLARMEDIDNNKASRDLGIEAQFIEDTKVASVQEKKLGITKKIAESESLLSGIRSALLTVTKGVSNAIRDKAEAEAEELKAQSESTIATSEAGEAAKEHLSTLQKYIQEYEKATGSADEYRRALSEIAEVESVLAGGGAAAKLKEMGATMAQAQAAIQFKKEESADNYVLAMLKEMNPAYEVLAKNVDKAGAEIMDVERDFARLAETGSFTAVEMELIRKALEKFRPAAEYAAGGFQKLDEEFQNLKNQAAIDWAKLVAPQDLKSQIDIYAESGKFKREDVASTLALQRATEIFGDSINKARTEQEKMADAEYILLLLGEKLNDQQKERFRQDYAESFGAGAMEKANQQLRDQISLAGESAATLDLYNAIWQETNGHIEDVSEQFLKAKIENIQLLEELKKIEEVNAIYKSFADGVQGLFRDMFNGGIKSFKDFSKRLKGLFRTMIGDLIFTAAKNSIMSTLFKVPAGGTGGAAGGAGGLDFGSLISGITGAFGGNGGGANISSVQAMISQGQSAISSGSGGSSYLREGGFQSSTGGLFNNFGGVFANSRSGPGGYSTGISGFSGFGSIGGGKKPPNGAAGAAKPGGGAGGMTGTQGFMNGAMGAVGVYSAYRSGDPLGGALSGAMAGAYFGPIGMAIGAIVGALAGLLGGPKTPDLRLGGVGVTRKPEQTFQTAFGSSQIGVRSGVNADEFKKLVTDFDANIHKVVLSFGNGTEQVEAIKKRLATWALDLKGDAITAEAVLGSRFNAIMSTFSTDIQTFVGLTGTVEERVKKLAEASVIEAGVKSGETKLNFSQLAGVLVKVKNEGEEMKDTFNRVVASTKLVEETMATFGYATRKTREQFVTFSAELVESLGGLDEASEKLRTFAAAYGDISGDKKAAALGNRTELVEAVGLDKNTSMAEFASAFSRVVKELDPAKLAQWIEAGNAIAVVGNSLEAMRKEAEGIDETLPQKIKAQIDAMAELGALPAELAQAAIYGQQIIGRAVDELMEDMRQGANAFGSDDLAQSLEQQIAAIAELTDDEVTLAQARAYASQTLKNALDDFMYGIDSQIDGLTGRSHVRAIEDLNRAMKENQRRARALGATTQQLARIEYLAALQFNQIINELRASIADLANQLYGPEEKEEDSSEDSSSLYDSQSRMYEAAQNMFDSIKDFLDSLEVGELAPGSWDDKLGAAERQFREMLLAAQGGDPEAMEGITEAAQTYLSLAREYFGSTTDYAEVFDFVTGALRSLQTLYGNVEKPQEASSSGSDSSSDKETAEQRAARRFKIAFQLAQELGELGIALKVSVYDLMREFGVDIKDLAVDLGIDVNDLNKSMVTNIGMMAAALGIGVDELVNKLGLTSAEIAEAFGIKLDDFSSSNVSLIASLASSLGLSVFEAISFLGMDLQAMALSFGASMTDLGTFSFEGFMAMARALSLDIVTLADQLGTDFTLLAQGIADQVAASNLIPQGVKDDLAPYLEAIRNADTSAGVKTATDAMGNFIKDKHPELLGAFKALGLVFADKTDGVAGTNEILKDFKKDSIAAQKITSDSTKDVLLAITGGSNPLLTNIRDGVYDLGLGISEQTALLRELLGPVTPPVPIEGPADARDRGNAERGDASGKGGMDMVSKIEELTAKVEELTRIIDARLSHSNETQAELIEVTKKISKSARQTANAPIAKTGRR